MGRLCSSALQMTQIQNFWINFEQVHILKGWMVAAKLPLICVNWSLSSGIFRMCLSRCARGFNTTWLNLANARLCMHIDFEAIRWNWLDWLIDAIYPTRKNMIPHSIWMHLSTWTTSIHAHVLTYHINNVYKHACFARRITQQYIQLDIWNSVQIKHKQSTLIHFISIRDEYWKHHWDTSYHVISHHIEKWWMHTPFFFDSFDAIHIHSLYSGSVYCSRAVCRLFYSIFIGTAKTYKLMWCIINSEWISTISDVRVRISMH